MSNFATLGNFSLEPQITTKEDDMMINDKRGFTLIEVIVVVGIIAILAGILVPMIFNQIDEAKIARAQADTKSISTAIQTFRKDTGKWPSFSGGTYPCSSPANGGDAAVITALNSDGDMPTITGSNWDTSNTYSISTVLMSSNSCYPVPANSSGPGWKGPYMNATLADPWGNKYLVNAIDFENATKGVFVISAGPNGILETNANYEAVGGDDIGIKIK